MQNLIDIIEKGWDQKTNGDIIRGNQELEAAVQNAISLLDKGEARVAEKTDDGWQVNQWLKKAVLLSFHLHDSEVIAGSDSNFFDKVPLKYAGTDHDDFEAAGVRVVPGARVRQGAYIAPDVVLMPRRLEPVRKSAGMCTFPVVLVLVACLSLSRRGQPLSRMIVLSGHALKLLKALSSRKAL